MTKSLHCGAVDLSVRLEKAVSAPQAHSGAVSRWRSKAHPEALFQISPEPRSVEEPLRVRSSSHHLGCSPMVCLCDGDWSAELLLGRNWNVSVSAFALFYLHIQVYSAKKPCGILSLWGFSIFLFSDIKIWVISWYVNICAYYKICVCMHMLAV